MVKGYRRTNKEDLPAFRAEIKKLYEEGVLITEIARRVQKHHSSVIANLKAQGIALPTRQVSSSRTRKDQPMKLSSIERISADGRIFGRSYRQLLKDYGVENKKEWWPNNGKED